MSHHTTGYRIDNLDIHYWYYEIMRLLGNGSTYLRVDLTGDEDPTDEDGDIGMGDLTGVSMYLGGKISSRGKKSQESNIGDSYDNQWRWTKPTTVGWSKLGLEVGGIGKMQWPQRTSGLKRREKVVIS
ncbi:hypothetical protein Tco_0683422 [Tanacetum coccineum]|uniref:Uncharacterized protein n=1 Tax=Tanacetum coccineum TaxID=301880 RepID=A0ABQ4XV47_9ASTR